MATSNTPLVLDDAVDLTDNAIQKIWPNIAPKTVEHLPKFVNVETGVNELLLKESDVSDLGLAGRRTENASVVFESPVQGFDQTYEQEEFALGFAVTKKMWKFGIKKRKLESLVQELKEACVRKRERLAQLRIVNAQSASYTENDAAGNYTVTTTNANGVALCSASQTREDSGTNNNNVIYNGTNYNPTAGYNALKALARTAALVLSPKGNQLQLNPTRIFVKRGSDAYFSFKQVQGAIRNGKLPETFSNDGSGVADFELIELQYLTSNTAWHAVDPNYVNDKNGLQYKESQPITLEGPNVVFRTGEIQYLASALWAIGCKDYRGHFNSDGSGN